MLSTHARTFLGGMAFVFAPLLAGCAPVVGDTVGVSGDEVRVTFVVADAYVVGSTVDAEIGFMSARRVGTVSLTSSDPAIVNVEAFTWPDAMTDFVDTSVPATLRMESVGVARLDAIENGATLLGSTTAHVVSCDELHLVLGEQERAGDLVVLEGSRVTYFYDCRSGGVELENAGGVVPVVDGVPQDFDPDHQVAVDASMTTPPTTVTWTSESGTVASRSVVVVPHGAVARLAMTSAPVAGSSHPELSKLTVDTFDTSDRLVDGAFAAVTIDGADAGAAPLLLEPADAPATVCAKLDAVTTCSTMNVRVHRRGPPPCTVHPTIRDAWAPWIVLVPLVCLLARRRRGRGAVSCRS